MQTLSIVKKPILLTDLLSYEVLDKVVIESIEQALYRMEVVAGGESFYVIEEVKAERKSLIRRSIVEIQTLLIPFTIKSMFLKHNSPYDEMIGHDVNEFGNELLVPLGNYFADEKNAVKH